MVPKQSVIDRSGFLVRRDVGTGELAEGSLSESESSEVDDVVLAVGNHLVGNLDEKSGHSFVGVVVTSDGVDHFNRVHKSRKSLLDGLGCAFVEGFDELFQGLKVLDIVFGFIKSFSNSQLDAGPLASSKVKLVLGSVSAIRRTSSGCSQDVEHLDAVLRGELLRHAGKLSHTLFPVFKFLTGTGFLIVLFLGLCLFEGLLNLLRPLVEDLLEVVDHVGVDSLCVGGDSTR